MTLTDSTLDNRDEFGIDPEGPLPLDPDEDSEAVVPDTVALLSGQALEFILRMDRLEINNCSPHFCFVRCQMKPSMKPGMYKVALLLKREAGRIGSIARATCECAAG